MSGTPVIICGQCKLPLTYDRSSDQWFAGKGPGGDLAECPDTAREHTPAALVPLGPVVPGEVHPAPYGQAGMTTGRLAAILALLAITSPDHLTLAHLDSDGRTGVVREVTARPGMAAVLLRVEA